MEINIYLHFRRCCFCYPTPTWWPTSLVWFVKIILPLPCVFISCALWYNNFKIITLLIQKKKKKIKSKYTIWYNNLYLKRLRIRQALVWRLLSRRGYYWEWERKGRGIWHFDGRKREVLEKSDVWQCEGSVCIYVRVKNYHVISFKLLKYLVEIFKI